MLTSALSVVFWVTVIAWLARRRMLRETADELRRFSEHNRRVFLTQLPDIGVRHALHNLVRDDLALEDEASVARFHFAPGTRRLVLWQAQKAAFIAAGCLTIIIVSEAVNPLLNVLFGSMAASFIGLAAWRLLRLRRMGVSYEVSAFNLTEIRERGERRTLSWRQPLVLRNRRWRRCVEVGPQGSNDVIRLDYQLLEFYRAVHLVVQYGGFAAQAPATQYSPPPDGALLNVVTWGEALPVPMAVGRYRLTHCESHPDPMKGTLYRYSDGSPTQVAVFIYPVGADVQRGDDPDGWVQAEGEKFAEELSVARKRGHYDDFRLTCMKAEPFVIDGITLFGHKAGAVVRRGATEREERQYLYLIRGTFLKVLTSELTDSIPRPPIPQFTRLLVMALVQPREGPGRPVSTASPPLRTLS